MNAAANFAFANRQVMTTFVRAAFRARLGAHLPMPSVYDVPHNMAKLERHGGEDLWVHRKGATRAFGPDRMTGTPFAATGQPVLIPGSMGTASYLLVAGERAADALWSVNHGAGRVMSRTAAAGRYTRSGHQLKPGLISDAEFERAMKGVVLIAESRQGAREEAPQAYKDIDLVVETVAGAGLGRIVARMTPLAVLKG
jgi:tRNA-splicing ligase RtcB